MTKQVQSFDFSVLRAISTDWPTREVPASGGIDGPLERLRSLLRTWQTTRVAPARADLAVLFRHVLVRERLNRSEASLIVPNQSEWPTIDEWRETGVVASPAGTNALHLSTSMPMLQFLGAGANIFEDAYRELPSQKNPAVAIDPFLSAAFGHSDYKCHGQREAVRALFLLPPGYTLIANLPTGSGKSMLAQAPILCEGWEGKLTVVVVPTVALVLDQARRMQTLLERRFPHRNWSALGYHGGLAEDEKVAIRQAIRSGSQGIVFAAPESIASGLAPAISDAAYHGFLRYLVVDEAHLITGWGDAFRLDFQALAGQRRSLMRRSGETPFRTILMSATLTEDVIDTLRQLFGPDEKTELISSVHLRPEPRYWFHKVADESTRRAHVIEAVQNAPRPLILYATTREGVVFWGNELLKVGYQRMAIFHGGTTSDERETILADWAAGRIDVVVANSAFGLGVDKQDVRAVIHATVPEGLDRFYQEVGRGGRDGLASASLTLWIDEDVEIAKRLSRTTLIGDNLGFARWNALIHRATRSTVHNSHLILDLETVPAHLDSQSRATKDWNIHTILMVARAGLIELVSGAEQFPIDESKDSFFIGCEIRILDPRHSNESHWTDVVGRSRDVTRVRQDRGIDRLLSALNRSEEISVLLRDLYTSRLPGATVSVSPCCGGCPMHWDFRQVTSRYLEPETPIAQFVREESLLGWHSVFDSADLRSQLVLYESSEIEGSVLIEALEKIISNLPIQEMVLQGRMPNYFLQRLRERLTKTMKPIFLEVLPEIVPASFAYRRHTIRLSLVGLDVGTPECLLDPTSPARFELKLIPSELQDPFHPLRLFRDTAPRHSKLTELVEALN
jgi:superfamily II DNA helicase RecQ